MEGVAHGRAPSPLATHPMLRRTFRSLRHPNFRLFFAGQLLSLVGTWMQNVAQLWLVYRLTGSGMDLGLAGFMNHFPVALLAPWGGMLADRMDRRRLLLLTQTVAMLQAALLAALTLSGHVQVWHVYLLAGVLGLSQGVDIPARQSFIIEMVGREDLPNAIALNSSMFNAARLLGPAGAGLLVAFSGEGICFLFNAVSFVCVIVALLAMRLPRRSPPERQEPVLSAIAEGFAHAWRTPAIRGVLLMVALGSLMGVPYAVLLPIIADKTLGAGPQGLGWLASSAGLGAVLGALTLAVRGESRGLGGWVAAAACGFGIGLLCLAASSSLPWAMASLVLVGLCMVVQMAGANILLQTRAGDHMRGRIMSLFSMMYMGMVPLGSLWSGALADRLGPSLTIALGGICCLAGGAAFGAALRRAAGRADA